MELTTKQIILIATHDRFACVSLGIVLALSLFLSSVVSPICGVLIPCLYVGGIVAFYFLSRSDISVENTLPLPMVGGSKNEIFPQHSGCSTCGDNSCKRVRVAQHQCPPWEDLHINEELDKAVESLLNKILQEFVSSWFSSISLDENFELELRHSLRYACSILLRRGVKVDLVYLIFQKVLPACVVHLNDYLTIREMSEKQRIPFIRASVKHLGSRLHPATFNRDQELEYLRHLTECLLPSLLSHAQLNCQNFQVLMRELLAGWVLLPLADVLADPTILNSLLLLLLGHQQLTHYKDVNEPRVNFLQNFIAAPVTHTSALHPDLSSILKDQKLLYAFMQFLKGEGAVNMLQFCLDVEEFNRKMLTPDMSPEDLELLYRDAMDLFSVYFSPDSPDNIGLPSDIVFNMKQVLTEDVGKLRTSPPLFQAYEHAYSILENKLCPLFHASDDFFKWLSGPRILSSVNRSGTSSPLQQGSPGRSRQSRRPNDAGGSTVARISSRLHKIKGVLRGPVEGHTFESDAGIDLADSEFAEEMQISDALDRDLSAWRVSIPSVETRLDGGNKYYSAFIIDVQRIDVTREGESEGSHWSVERRYNDFYTLESKLTEFHGEFVDNQLPARRMLFFSAPRAQFLESRKQVFEDYIQRLLGNPALRGSDLLFAFLRIPGEFSDMNASPDGLSRLIRRTVPLSLRKEKGQHLEPFINAFFTSTEGKKLTKLEYKDVSQESPYCRNFRIIMGPVFRNNFNLVEENLFPDKIPDASVDTVDQALSESYNLRGLSNCLIYVGVCVYNMPRSSLRIALAVRALLGRCVDALVCFFVGRALKKLLVAPRLAHLVHLLQGAIFSCKNTVWNSMEVEEKACRKLDEFCSSYWGAKLATPAFKGAFCALQCPQLNKQLLYTLLDIIMIEIFPELHFSENLSSTPQSVSSAL